MLAGLLACARLGAVFVPLNWRLAPAELVAIADHAGLAALEHTPELADLAAQVRAGARLAGGAPLLPGDVLLVYTSGTTGEPKGALHTQAGMLANIDMPPSRCRASRPPSGCWRCCRCSMWAVCASRPCRRWPGAAVHLHAALRARRLADADVAAAGARPPACWCRR
jgi:acyl-CoA synthetase (AMP-forming)/AMP-acid ligase II